MQYIVTLTARGDSRPYFPITADTPEQAITIARAQASADLQKNGQRMRDGSPRVNDGKATVKEWRPRKAAEIAAELRARQAIVDAPYRG